MLFIIFSCVYLIFFHEEKEGRRKGANILFILMLVYRIYDIAIFIFIFHSLPLFPSPPTPAPSLLPLLYRFLVPLPLLCRFFTIIILFSCLFFAIIILFSFLSLSLLLCHHYNYLHYYHRCNYILFPPSSSCSCCCSSFRYLSLSFTFFSYSLLPPLSISYPLYFYFVIFSFFPSSPFPSSLPSHFLSLFLFLPFSIPPNVLKVPYIYFFQ